MRLNVLILLLFLSPVLFCQNNLNVVNLKGELFKVYVNGQQFNSVSQAGVSIQNIKTDKVSIKIELDTKQSVENIIYLLDKGRPVNNKEFNYTIETVKGKTILVFGGISEILPLPDPLIPAPPVIDTTSKYRNNVLGHYCELKDSKPIYFNNIPKTGACAAPMPLAYLNYLNLLMVKAQSDDDKYLIAENTCNNNCISVSQLNKILSYIPYELEKLKLVRIAYFHLTDNYNKNNLDSAFKLEASKSELGTFFKNSEDYKIKTGASCKESSAENEINALVDKLSIYNNDSERFAVFKKSYADYCYTSQHIKTILSKFIHDREKLDAGKLLYFHCIDKDKFTEIADVFSYNTSIAELNEFVAKQKN